jgi:hypothetical protein
MLGFTEPEGNMPHRRRTQKGSFGGHFDEIVEHFPHDESAKRSKPDKRDEKDDSNVHDKLFESAWRKSRETQSSRFSNQ